MAQLRAPAAPSSLVPSEADLTRTRGLAEALLENPVAHALLESVPGYALILTGDRKLLAGHGEVLEELGLTTPESLQGLRAGELFRCIPVRDGFSRSRQFWVTSVPLRVGGGEALLFIFKETTEQNRREMMQMSLRTFYAVGGSTPEDLTNLSTALRILFNGSVERWRTVVGSRS